MYEFSPVTERIKAMHERIRARVIEIDPERALIVTESYQRNENVPWMIKIPRATYDVCAKKTIIVEDDDIFVGNQRKAAFGVADEREWSILTTQADHVVQDALAGRQVCVQYSSHPRSMEDSYEHNGNHLRHPRLFGARRPWHPHDRLLQGLSPPLYVVPQPRRTFPRAGDALQGAEMRPLRILRAWRGVSPRRPCPLWPPRHRPGACG